MGDSGRPVASKSQTMRKNQAKCDSLQVYIDSDANLVEISYSDFLTSGMRVNVEDFVGGGHSDLKFRVASLAPEWKKLK